MELKACPPSRPLVTKQLIRKENKPINKLEAIFCDVDDFCQPFIPEWEKPLVASGERQLDGLGGCKAVTS